MLGRELTKEEEVKYVDYLDIMYPLGWNEFIRARTQPHLSLKERVLGLIFGNNTMLMLYTIRAKKETNGIIDPLKLKWINDRGDDNGSNI